MKQLTKSQAEEIIEQRGPRFEIEETFGMAVAILVHLSSLSMGGTRFELRQDHEIAKFNKIYKCGYKHNKEHRGHGPTTDRLSNVLIILQKSGLVEKALFRSGQKNGQGAAAYRLAF